MAEGATIQMLRLTDLHLDSCTGCMRCVIGGKPCPLDDHMAWLVDVIGGSDGLVLAVPTYFLGPAAILKLVLDRLLMVTGKVDQALPQTRPAVTMATAGLEGWRGVTLPFLNAFAAAFGFRPIERLTAVAPGPGEVLLDDELLARVLEAGHRLGRREMEPSQPTLNVCPICYCDSFVLNGSLATCPVCGREATVEMEAGDVRLHFHQVQSTHQRWTPEGLRAHMVDWVMATGPRYMERRPEIKARRRPFRQMDVDWLQPPTLGGSGQD
jgi:uncharacterized Zn finger protein (UPF0148 family)